MVLVGQRRAEERHDPVAHHLVDGALVAVDRLHHVLEHGVEELARLLGVAVGEQLHRALEVGEEHGDLLALAFERGLGGEDLLGEMLGGVGLGCDEAAGLPRRLTPPTADRTGCRTALARSVALATRRAGESRRAPQPWQNLASEGCRAGTGGTSCRRLHRAGRSERAQKRQRRAGGGGQGTCPECGRDFKRSPDGWK